MANKHLQTRLKINKLANNIVFHSNTSSWEIINDQIGQQINRRDKQAIGSTYKTHKMPKFITDFLDRVLYKSQT